MKTWIAGVALMCVAFAAFAQPKIEIVGGTKFDFGNIYRGKKVDHKVIAKNIGNKPLELGRIDVSCGCTGTAGANTTIAPGKTGEVVITFNSTNFSGKIHKTVTINSNAANAPQTMIEFEGNVIQEIAISPAQFWFRDAEVNRPSIARVVLTNNSSEPISLTGYTSNLHGLQLKLPSDPIKPGESIELAAELKAKGATQVLNERVAIKTTSKNEPEVQVLIFGAVKEFKFQ